MSGLEVLGGISAVIAIIDGSMNIWDNARKDLEFSATFETVANRLPVLRDTFQACHKRFEPIKASLSADVAQSLVKTVESCKSKARKLGTIFQETIPGKDDQFSERYRKVSKRWGKTTRVEELMKSIAEDAQNLVNYHAVKSTQPELYTKLEEIIKEMDLIDPSLSVNEAALQTSEAYSGQQNVSTESGMQYNSFSAPSGTTHNYSRITGSPIFSSDRARAHFGDHHYSGGLTINSNVALLTDYTGVYAHNAMVPVSTYIDRPKLCQQLEEQFHNRIATPRYKTQTVIVHGIGGGGKTQLVLDYVQRYQQDYSAIFWIEAASPEAIERDYKQIYVLLYGTHQQAEQGTIELQHAVPAVKRWFYGRGKRCMLVFDNADSISDPNDPSYVDLRRFLPDDPCTHIIVTTRDRLALGMSELPAIEVDEMTKAEAVMLFQKQAKTPTMTSQQEEQIALIVQELGYLALAVTLAASYVAATPRLSSDLARYLPEYRVRRRELLAKRPTWLVHQYGESVLSTWETTYRVIERQGPGACQFLALLSFFDPDDIPSTFPISFIHGEGPTWESVLFPRKHINENDIEGFFRTLTSFSFIKYREYQSSYSMHSLVQAWAYDRLTEDQQRHYSRVGALLLQTMTDAAKKADPVTRRRCVPHVLSCCYKIFKCFESASGEDEIIVDLLSELALFLDSCGYSEDKAVIERFVLRKYQSWYGEDHFGTLGSMNNLAITLRDMGELQEARSMQRVVLERYKQMLGDDHPDTLGSMNNLATTLRDVGELQEALSMKRAVLAKQQQILGDDHPDTLRSMNNLASTLGDVGELQEALLMQRAVLEKRRQILGNDHPDTLRSMNNLASTLGDVGELQEALSMQRAVLEKQKQIHGNDHPDTLRSMNNLASTLGDVGELQEALSMKRAVLAKQQQILGDDHPDTLRSMNNLASTLGDVGELQEALSMQRAVLEKYIQKFGDDHPDTLRSRRNLALVLSRQGNYEEAKIVLGQTLQLMKIVLGPGHPETITSNQWLDAMLIKQGSREHAEMIHRKASEGPDTMQAAETFESDVGPGMEANPSASYGRSSYTLGDEHHRRYNTPLGQTDQSRAVHQNIRKKRATKANPSTSSYTTALSKHETPFTSRAILDKLVYGVGDVGDVLSEVMPSCFSLNFDLVDFVSTELGGIADDILNMVVLSGAEGVIWAGSVQEYVSARWPQSADSIKRIILSLAGSQVYIEGPQMTKKDAPFDSSHDIYEDSNVGMSVNDDRIGDWTTAVVKAGQSGPSSWTSQNAYEGLMISLLPMTSSSNDPSFYLSLTGKLDRRAEVIEALGWLYAVMPNGKEAPFPCTVRLILTGTDDRGSWCTLERQQHSEFRQDIPGRCWMPLFPRTACAANFVNPFWRPSKEELLGIELTFDLLCMLCGLYYGNEHEGGLFLYGDCTFVYPVAQFENCVQWHFQVCQPGDNPRQLIDGKRLKGKGLDDLRAYTRHFLGLWKDPEITLGSEDSQPRKVQFSSTKTLESTHIRDSFAVAGSVKLPGVVTLTGSTTYKVAKTRQTPLLKGPIVDQLHSKINSPVLLYSPSEKRGWLVSFVSVVLHIARCRAFARAELGYSVPACKRSADGGRAAWECIKEHQNECVKQAGPNEILTDLEKSFRVIDHIEEVIACVNLLRRETNCAQGFFRDQVLGFELAALTMYKDSASLKKCELEAFADGWRPLLDKIESVFFYEGLPDPIVPSSMSKNAWTQGGACGVAMLQRVPRNFNLLTASLPCLLSMAEEQGQNDDGTMKRLTSSHAWHCPTGDSLYVSCTTGLSCSCDHLQKVVPARRSHFTPRIRFSETNTGAVLFTSSIYITMAELRCSVAKETRRAPSEMTISQVDSGYVSEQLRDFSPANTIENASQDPFHSLPNSRVSAVSRDSNGAFGSVQEGQTRSVDTSIRNMAQESHAVELQQPSGMRGRGTDQDTLHLRTVQTSPFSPIQTLGQNQITVATMDSTQLVQTQPRAKKGSWLRRVITRASRLSSLPE